MILTQEIMNAAKSSRGGYSANQFAQLGVTNAKNLKKGWLKELIGKDFDENNLREFVNLKDSHLSATRIQKAKIKKVGKNRPTFTPCFQKLSFQDQYLHPNWQQLRLFVLSRDKFTCQECGDTTKTLHAHHLKYLRDKYVWEVPHYYLVTLCEDCHSKEHGRDLTARRL